MKHGRRPLSLLLVTLAIGVVPVVLAGQARSVAVTFDDAPRGGPGLETEGLRQLNEKLVRSIVRHGVPAVAFVNEGKLYVDDQLDAERVEALAAWPRAGFELGNHTYSHPSLSRIPVAEYIEDVIRGETVTRELLERSGMQLRYFRHPFLHVGADIEERRTFERWLAEHEYTIAPVTVENADYLYAVVYSDAKASADSAEMRRVVDAYLTYTDRQFDFWEPVADMLSRDRMPQVLLLHVNELNADHFSSIVKRLEHRGYGFVTLDDALAHEAYQRPDEYVGAFGPVWLYRWGREAKLEVEWAEEPEPQQWVTEAFQRIRTAP